MVLTVKNRISIYRRFGIDPWGISLYRVGKVNKATSFLAKLFLKNKFYSRTLFQRYKFTMGVNSKVHRKSRVKWGFVSLRLLKLFYLTLSYLQLRTMIVRASKRDGLFQNNYCLFLEGRLLPIVYRTNFFYNMFEIRDFIKNANVFVNGVCINYPNYLVSIGDIITFNRYYLNYFKRSLLQRLRSKCIFFNTPRYIYVNYKLFFTFMERLPFVIDLAFPSKIDILRIISFK